MASDKTNNYQNFITLHDVAFSRINNLFCNEAMELTTASDFYVHII
jgi:hypothetical protein